MFAKRPDDPELQEIIDVTMIGFRKTDPDSPEFAKICDLLIKLQDAKRNPRNRVSADVWATIAANLAGIALIIGHERAHIVTSKALGFVQKLR